MDNISGKELIAYNHIKACFNYEVGGWYNSFQDGYLERLPIYEEDAKDCIYENSISNSYHDGGCFYDRPIKEIRFVGKKFIKECIDELFSKDEDIAEIRNALWK